MFQVLYTSLQHSLLATKMQGFLISLQLVCLDQVEDFHSLTYVLSSLTSLRHSLLATKMHVHSSIMQISLISLQLVFFYSG